MSNDRRIKKKVTVNLTIDNIDFIHQRVLPANPDKFKGSFTRGAHECVDVWLKELDGAIPEMPQREEASFSMASLTLQPETLAAVDRIVGFWNGTDQQCSRSAVVDYFITLSRQRYENRQNQ